MKVPNGTPPWKRPEPVPEGPRFPPWMFTTDATTGELRPIKVSLAIPSRDQVETGFAFDLVKMVGSTVASSPIEVQPLFDRGTLLVSQRENLVKVARRMGADYMLWLDSDMRFPADTLLRLLQRQVPIVACNYATRRTPVTTVAFPSVRNPQPTGRLYTFPDSTGLEPVEAIGMGVMLVKMSVYDDLPRPWFQLAFDPASDDFHGEDVHFCRLVRAKGYEVLVDHDLSKQIQHVGVWAYKHEHACAHLALAREDASADTLEPVEGA